MQSAVVSGGAHARPRIMGRASTHGWVAVAGVTLLAAIGRFALFGRVPGNPYYDAAVRSMGLSWHNFFYGAFEPGAQVSIDKAPIDLWLQVASVKLLGFGPVALRLPEALAGALAVPLLYDLVRRLFGHRAAIVSALALAVLPAAVLNARSDTMDSLMMLLLVAAGWLIVRGAQARRGWPVIAAGAVIGLAFNVKLFEALVALPALALLAVLATDVRWQRRVVHLAGGAVAFVGVALAWVATASIAPLGSRPYPIGSTNGGVWNVVFGFNGIDRLRGGPTAAVAAFDPAGPGRLFATGGRHLGALIGVLLVPAIALGVLALVERLTRSAPDSESVDHAQARLRRAGVAFLAVWLLSGVLLFSAVGRMQVRYLEAITPAVAAVVGVAFAALSHAAGSRPAAAGLLAAGAALTALIVPSIAGAPGSVAALALAAAALTVIAAIALASARAAHRRPRSTAILAAAALTAILVTAVVGSIDVVRSGATSAQRAGSMPAAQLDALSGYLRARTAGARYEVASSTVGKAAPLIIRDGRPVLMLTSLKRRALLTDTQLARAVRTGEVRYVLIGRGACSPRSTQSCPPVLRWARTHSTDVSAAAGLRTGTLSRLSTSAVRR